MALADSDIADLTKGTLRQLGRFKFNQIATKLQRHEIMSRIMRKDKVVYGDGHGLQKTIMTDHSGAAHQTTLYAADKVNVGDVLQQIQVPWRHTNTNYGYDRRELLMNRGASRIVSLLKVRRADAMISMVEHMENQGWSLPSSSTDKLDVFGIPYWIIYDSSSGGAFTTADATGFADGPGGLDPATYTRWANWSDTYSAITKADLITKMRNAYNNIHFENPVGINDFRRGRGDDFRIYVDQTTKRGLEDLGEDQNENLGRDLASMDGIMTFRGNPVIWVPHLDANAPTGTTNPIYMINFNWMEFATLQGDFLRETEPFFIDSQHNVWVIHVDLTWNLLCTNRRFEAVISK